MPPQEKDPLEAAEERLYRPQEDLHFNSPSFVRVNSASGRLATNWQPPPPPKQRKPISWAIIFLMIAVVFFLAAGGLSLLFLYTGGRSVSNDNITMSVQAPPSIASGSVVPLSITVDNHNPEAISNVNLSMTFPAGTRSADDVSQPLLRYSNTFGNVAAGGTLNQTVQAVLFGSANQTVTIPVTLQYRVVGSSELFQKQETFTFTITSSPLTIAVTSVSSIASGQPFSIAIAVHSNATSPLTNVALEADYPPGFSVVTGGTATNAGPIYALGEIDPGQEKDFTVIGTLAGTDQDIKDFQFSVGTPATDGSQSLGVVYATNQSEITISKPFIDVAVSVNHDSTDPTVVQAGEPISAFVSWVNSLTTAISNAQIKLQLSGNALDPNSVTTTTGFYDSSNQSVLFNESSQSNLAQLQPGDSGNGSFNFSTLTGKALTSLRNPTIQIAVSIAGQPSSATAPEVINTTLTRSVEIATDFELQSKIVHSVGPFKDAGPWPPVVNQPTTYTVELSVTNTVNSVGGGTVTMILPPYVTFTGQVNPNDGSISYNTNNHTVTWKVGSVDAGTGIDSPAATAAFQISFTPSSSQVGSSPVLIENQLLTGTDRFTSTQVGTTVSALTIQTSSDPAFNPGFGEVTN